MLPRVLSWIVSALALLTAAATHAGPVLSAHLDVSHVPRSIVCSFGLTAMAGGT